MIRERTPSDAEAARERFRAAADRLTQTTVPVRRHPWITLGVAFGVGVAVGLSPTLRRSATRLAGRWFYGR